MSAPTLRRLTPEDWRAYRELRLESLDRHPDVFCPSRDEAQFSEADWRGRLGEPDAAAFGLYHEGRLVGITGIVRRRDRADTAELVSSYIREGLRGRGLSKLLYEARLAWARAQPGLEVIRVEHAADNLASAGAHRAFGFTLVEEGAQTWPDGSCRAKQTYQLRIR